LNLLMRFDRSETFKSSSPALRVIPFLPDALPSAAPKSGSRGRFATCAQS
jgi:hypothetical protein